MEEILREKVGRRFEIFFGASTLRGEIREVRQGVLYLRDNKHLNYIAIGKITFARELLEGDELQAGFVATSIE